MILVVVFQVGICDVYVNVHEALSYLFFLDLMLVGELVPDPGRHDYA